MQNGEICLDRNKIGKIYIKKVQFKLDILSILPTDIIYFYFFPNFSRRYLAALRLNRLFKFSRLNEFRNITETQTKFPTIFRMSNLLINILLAMHWNACIYFIISNLVGFGEDEWVFPKLTNLMN